jgi:hypothetical protein
LDSEYAKAQFNHQQNIILEKQKLAKQTSEQQKLQIANKS